MLETARCVLRPFIMNDLEDIARLHSHPDVMHPIFGGPRSHEQATLDLENDIRHQATYGFSKWAVFLKGDQRFIGRAGFALWEATGEVEVGYKFFPTYWRQGYATEVLKALLVWGKLHIPYPIVAFTYEENLASLKVMKKAGMVYLRHDVYEGHDVVVYGIPSEQR